MAGDGAELEPNAARVYDYLLGGDANFAVDRAFGRRLEQVSPHAATIARSGRGFLRRAVRYLTGAGIDQFLDLGSGLPTAGNVHEIARRGRPDARVVYVDNEPVAVHYSGTLLPDRERVGIIQADLRDPDLVLGHPETRRLLDLRRPVAVLMSAVLHFVPDSDRPAALVARYLDATVPGSYLLVSHLGFEERLPAEAVPATGRYRQTATPVHPRHRWDIAALFDGMELVPPGLVLTPHWRPDSEPDADDLPERIGVYAAVARKP
jgi:SAM-dependent methyltransferase